MDPVIEGELLEGFEGDDEGGNNNKFVREQDDSRMRITRSTVYVSEKPMLHRWPPALIARKDGRAAIKHFGG